MAPYFRSRAPFLAAALLTVASVAAVFSLIGRLELTFDEAYYTLWSRHLAWGYFDHPPMVALWIRGSTALFGDSEFSVRALGAAVFACVPILVGVVAARLFESAKVGAYATLAWLAMPLGVGAALVTPDAPLTFFSLLALAGLVEVLRGDRWGWPLIGLALGLALQSKFTALFLGAGVALALAWIPALRPKLRSPAPYAAALLAVGMFAPFLLWNARHGWATFAKQFGRVPGHAFAPQYLLEFLAAQVGLANPLLTIAAAASFERDGGPQGEKRQLLVAFVAPALAYFVVHALHDRVQGNWTAPLYPALAMLAGETAARGPVWARRVAWLGIGFGAAVIALVYLHLATSWPALGQDDPLARIGGWRELAREVDAKAKAQGAAYILARGYAATSLLTYYGDGAAPVIQSGEAERWIFAPPPDAALFARPGLAIAQAKRGEEADLRSKFRSVEAIGNLPRRRAGAEVDDYELFRVAEPFGNPVAGP